LTTRTDNDSRVDNKGRRDSGFVTDDSLTLVTMAGLGQLTTMCS